LAAAATGLVVMHLAIKQKELDELDSESSYAAVGSHDAAVDAPGEADCAKEGAPALGWEAGLNLTSDPGSTI